MSEAVLTIGGEEYRGWTQIRVTRSLETLASSFDLTLTDRFYGGANIRPMKPHLTATVALDGTKVLTGVIDTVTPSYDRDRHEVRVTGRSLTGQLADCSVKALKGEFKGQSLAQIASRVADPFGIEVSDQTDAAEVFPRVVIEPGETCFDLLQRLADQRGVFLTDDAEGRLIIKRRSTTLQGAIENGVNVLSCNGAFEGQAQFSNYIVKGQTEGGDRIAVDQSTRSTGQAVDASVPINRPRIILADAQGDLRTMKERAEFEAARARGRARRWTYTLAGWRRPDDNLWTAGEEAEVIDDFMQLDADRLLVTATTFSLDERGEIIELEVAPPEGFDLRVERQTVARREKLLGWDSI